MKTIYALNIPVSDMHTRIGENAFAHQEDAEKAGKNIGWYGADASVVPIRVFDNLAEYGRQMDADKLEAARKKLSPEELQILERSFRK